MWRLDYIKVSIARRLQTAEDGNFSLSIRRITSLMNKETVKEYFKREDGSTNQLTTTRKLYYFLACDIRTILTLHFQVYN